MKITVNTNVPEDRALLLAIAQFLGSHQGTPASLYISNSQTDPDAKMTMWTNGDPGTIEQAFQSMHMEPGNELPVEQETTEPEPEQQPTPNKKPADKKPAAKKSTKAAKKPPAKAEEDSPDPKANDPDGKADVRQALLDATTDHGITVKEAKEAIREATGIADLRKLTDPDDRVKAIEAIDALVATKELK